VPDRKVRFAVDLSKFGAVRNLPGKPGDDAKWQSVSRQIEIDRTYVTFERKVNEKVYENV
jgi:hypothetical protein